MTKCKAMIEAFRLGGDFHSRTALSMYDYIKEDIAKGTCLLEWDSSKGEPPAAEKSLIGIAMPICAILQAP